MEKLKMIVKAPESEKDRELQKDALETLFSFERPENFLDKGGAGAVYSLPKGFCIKIIEDRHKSARKDIYDLGNPIAIEARLLERASNMEHGGKARTPRYLGYIVSNIQEQKQGIIMEELDALNLQHVLDGKFQLPDSFDLHVFFDSLESFVQKMHEEQNIIHGDLYARNIMVDRESGMPRIIDFGRAIDTSTLSDKPEKIEQYARADWQRLDEAYQAVATLQTKNK